MDGAVCHAEREVLPIVRWKERGEIPMRDWRGPIPTSEQLGWLRDHQESLYRRARDVTGRVVADTFTVLQATPGAGKTLAASIFAHVLLRSGFVDRVVIVVPRDSL